MRLCSSCLFSATLGCLAVLAFSVDSLAAAEARLDAPEISLELARQAPDIDLEVLEAALTAAECAQRADLARRQILSVIDYSLPSTDRRLWVFDLESKELLFHELVAHGINTGENLAKQFSNIEGSRQSSLGLFLTDRTYIGRNGYSLKLHGLEKGFNHRAWDRTIVLHGAWYVSDTFGLEHGRLGRSWGCPAVPQKVARSLINTIQDGSLLFVYYPDESWLSSSRFLNACRPDDRKGQLSSRLGR